MDALKEIKIEIFYSFGGIFDLNLKHGKENPIVFTHQRRQIKETAF